MSLSRLTAITWIIAHTRRSVQDHNTSLEGQRINVVDYLDVSLKVNLVVAGSCEVGTVASPSDNLNHDTSP